MNDPDSVEEFHAGGASSAGMQAVYDLSARALDALLPTGGRLLDLGVGSGLCAGDLPPSRSKCLAHS
jgi:tRNA (cmo5U34)-methyltransferase